MPVPFDIKKLRFQVRITALGREDYTGKIAKIAFKDGLSEKLLSYQEAMSVGAVIASEVAVEFDGELGDFGPANPAALAASFATEREDSPPNTVAESVVLPNIQPFAIKTIDAEFEYTLSNSDNGYLLDFQNGVVVVVPPNLLKEGFYCSLRQGGDNQIEVAPGDDPNGGNGATVEEIDDLYFSEKRLAILHLARFPNGSFQLTGRTGEAQ